MLLIFTILAGALLLGHFWRQRLLTAIVALSPLYVVRFTALDIPVLGRLPTTLLELGILGYLGASLLILARDRSARLAWWQAQRRGPLGMLPWAWLVLGLISVFFSPDRVAAFGIYRAYFVEPLALYTLILAEPDAAKTRETIRIGLLILMAWIGGLAFWQLLSRTGLQVGFVDNERGRALAVYNTPNALALLLVPLVGLFLPVGLTTVKNFMRITKIDRMMATFTLVSLLLALGGIFASYSLGGWGALVAVCLVTVLFLHGKRIWPWVVSALLITVSIGFLTLPRLQAYFVPTGNPRDVFGDNSANVRLAIWSRTVEMLGDRPLTGAGLAGFRYYYAQYDVPAHQEIPLYPHNIVLNFWSELGLLGPLLMLWLFWRVWQLGRRQQHSVAESERHALIGLLAFLTAIACHGLVDVPYFKNDLSLLFWIVLAWSLPKCETDSTSPMALG